MKRKIITMLLLLMFATSNVCGAFANEIDVQQTMYGMTEFDALSTMGLLASEFAAKRADDTVTRAEFVCSMAKIAGYISPEVDVNDIPFIDINLQTAYKNELLHFYNMGMIDPVTDSILDATGDITYSQAAKIAVMVLGYDEYTRSKYGEGANAYILTAQRLKLNDGLKNASANKPMTAQDAVVLMYNAATALVMEPTAFGSDGQVSYSSDGGKILLSQSNDIYYGEGIMQSNGYVSVATQNYRDERIVIGGAEYIPSHIDYSGYLGYNVQYFYKLDNNNPVLLWLAPCHDSRVLVIPSEDLIINDAQYSSLKIVYWEDGKHKTASIDEFADVICNNFPNAGYTASDLKPQQGEIKLIDNDSDKKYDIVIVQDYKNMAVKSVSSINMHIIGKYGDEIFLDNYEHVRIIKDGKIITTAEVPADCVISYCESKDGKAIFIWVNGEGTTEVLNFAADDGSETIYGFETGGYKLALSYKNLVESGEFTTVVPKTGCTYTYYLDKMGNIADIVEASTEIQYALVIDAKADDDPFSNGKRALFRLLLQNGDKVTAVTADKLSVDGVPGKTGADLLGDSRLSVSGSVERQVVRLSLNSSGEIKEFEFAAECTSPYGYDNNDFTLDYINSSAKYYTNSYYNFEHMYCTNSDTICFAYYTNWNTSEPYQVISGTDFAHESKYNVKIYDLNEKMEAKVVYVVRDTGGYQSDLFLVDDVTRVWDGENAYKQITGVFGGKNVTYLETEQGIIPDGIKRGDVINIALWNGKVSGVKKITSLADNPDAFTGTDMRFGQIYSMSGENIVLLKGEGEGDKLAPIGLKQWRTNITISVYDAGTNSIYPGTKNDLYQVSVPKSNGELIYTGREVKALVVTDETDVKQIIVAYY